MQEYPASGARFSRPAIPVAPGRAAADGGTGRLDAIEKAIRNALEKGDADDRAFREKVYRQAFSALERALQGNPSLTVESAIRRRKNLQDKITEIEAEYLPALPPLQAAGGQPRRVEPALDPSPEAAVVPGAIPVAPDIRVEATGPVPEAPDIMLETRAPQPSAPEPVLSEAAVKARDKAVARRERKRPFAAIFTGLTLLCLVAVGAWWVLHSGMLSKVGFDMTGIEEPAAETENFDPAAEGEPAKPGQADPARQWIGIFDPSDPSTVTAPGDSSADVLDEQGQKFMRIKSGATGSTILFDVGQGVLEQIAGKKVTFDVVARAQDGQDTQMSVACNFGELGDCGRTRYAVGATKADYLFEMTMPAVKPGAGGTIAINSDFANTGKSVDVYEVKVSVAP